MPINFDGFYDAGTARNISAGNAGGNGDVLAEINTLQVQVNTDALAGNLQINPQTSPDVSGITGVFGADPVFFDAWNEPNANDEDIHRIAREKMDRVIRYFTRIGYTIKRVRDGVTSTFKWQILW